MLKIFTILNQIIRQCFILCNNSNTSYIYAENKNRLEFIESVYYYHYILFMITYFTTNRRSISGFTNIMAILIITMKFTAHFFITSFLFANITRTKYIFTAFEAYWIFRIWAKIRIDTVITAECRCIRLYIIGNINLPVILYSLSFPIATSFTFSFTLHFTSFEGKGL